MEGGVAILCEKLLLHNLHDHVTRLSATLWISIDGDCLCMYVHTEKHKKDVHQCIGMQTFQHKHFSLTQ